MKYLKILSFFPHGNIWMLFSISNYITRSTQIDSFWQSFYLYLSMIINQSNSLPISLYTGLVKNLLELSFIPRIQHEKTRKNFIRCRRHSQTCFFFFWEMTKSIDWTFAGLINRCTFIREEEIYFHIRNWNNYSLLDISEPPKTKLNC